MVDYDIAGLLSGMFFIILGIILVCVSFVFWPIIFYAVACLGVGIAILVTLRKQDEIEQIHSEGKPIKRRKN